MAKDNFEFQHAISAHIETLIQTTLSVSSVCTLIVGFAETISDSFSLTDTLEFDIISKTKDKAYLDDLVSANIQIPLSDSFSISDNHTIQINSKTEDSISLLDRIFVIFDQARPIGSPIAIGNKLIG